MNYTSISMILIGIIFILFLVHIFLIWKEINLLNEKISQLNIQGNKSTNILKRNHSNINPVSFNNPIQSRKNLYDEYKNEKGLYEPVTPRKGLKIEEDK